MGERFVVIVPVGETIGKFAGCDGECGLVGGIALAENDEAHVVRQEAVKHRHENVEAFRADQTRHHSEDRAAWRRGELELIEQGVAGGGFELELVRAVTNGKQLVGCRVPAPVIRATGNPRKPVSMLAQYDVETFA